MYRDHTPPEPPPTLETVLEDMRRHRTQVARVLSRPCCLCGVEGLYDVAYHGRDWFGHPAILHLRSGVPTCLGSLVCEACETGIRRNRIALLKGKNERENERRAKNPAKYYPQIRARHPLPAYSPAQFRSAGG